jgi:hypothetical protein
MVVSKQIQGPIIESLYDSSNVIASKYNIESKKLVIIFGKGGQYLYENVEFSDFTKFDSSDSQGKSLNEFIKKYKAQKFPDIDVSSIKEDIKRLIQEQKK